MRQDKLARFFIILLLVVTAVATLYCYITPIQKAIIPKEDLTVEITGKGAYKMTVSGKIDNCTNYRVKKIEVVISTFDEFDFLAEEVVQFDIDFDAHESGTFEKTLVITTSGTIVDYQVEDIRCIYDKFPWYVVAIVGLAVVWLSKNLFAKRKYYFDVENSKVVIFASWKKAGVIVDGVLIKEGKLPKFKMEVVLFNMKVAGHKLKFYTLNGDIIPNIRALIDDKPVKYTKVRQNLFVKMMDEGVVRGKGDIAMKSKYESDGEAADKYNEERWAKAKANKSGNATQTTTNKTNKCPYCGATNNGDDKFCSSCGGKLD